MAGDGTQYTVDIETRENGMGAATAAANRLASGLEGAGGSASALAARYAELQAGVAAAAATSASANAAYKDGASAFSASEASAEKASKAAERLGQQVEAAAAKVAAMRNAASESGDIGAGYLKAVSSLDALTAKQAEAQARAESLSGALAGEAAALDALKSAADAAAAEHESLASAAESASSDVDKAAEAEKKAAAAAKGSGAVNEMAEAFGRMGGPAGAAGQKIFGLADGFKKMSSSVGALGPYVAIAAVILAITVGAIAATAALAGWAVGLADTKRSAQLSTEALSRTSDSLKNIATIMPAVTAKTGIAGDQLQDLAKQLDGAKVKAADMPAALEAAAMAEAALGNGGAQKLIEDLKSGKKTASELAAEMKSKFGDIVAKKMISLDGTAAKLKSNISALFGGLNIEGVLQSLSKMVGLLDANSASGKAIKAVFERIFQPIIDGAVAAYPTIERVVLGFVLGGLKMYNAMKPAVRAIGELIAAATGGEGSIEWADVGAGLFYVLAGAVASVVAAVAFMVAPFVLVVAAVYAFYAACMAAFDAVAGAIRSVMDIDLGGAASAMIDGFVQGIISGTASVISAVTNLASSAVSAAESAGGIASPSKAFAKIGGFSAEGMAGGVEDGTAKVETAVNDMVAVPSQAPAGKGGAGGGSGRALHVDKIEIHGSSDPQAMALALRDMLADLLDGGDVPAPVPVS